jgi:hypothetical protein
MPENEPAGSLLDLTPAELSTLSDAQVNATTALAQERVRQQAQYAKLGMSGSILVLLSCVGAYVYLVMQHHSTEAYVILGSSVLALITKILRSRL